MVACKEGHSQTVKLLLENSNNLNIDVNATSLEANGLMLVCAWGETAFMSACQRGRKDVVKLLLEYSEGNIDFNATDNGGRTAFMKACGSGHKDVVQLLLEYGKAKGIQIPCSQSILHGIFPKEIKNLIDEYHQSVIAENSFWTKWI